MSPCASLPLLLHIDVLVHSSLCHYNLHFTLCMIVVVSSIIIPTSCCFSLDFHVECWVSWQATAKSGLNFLNTLCWSGSWPKLTLSSMKGGKPCGHKDKHLCSTQFNWCQDFKAKHISQPDWSFPKDTSKKFRALRKKNVLAFCADETFLSSSETNQHYMITDHSMCVVWVHTSAIAVSRDSTKSEYFL